jgi:hypothetical protein
VVGKELMKDGMAPGNEVTFEIDGQLAGQITNVGGGQNTFLHDSDSGGSVFGRVVTRRASRASAATP